MQSIALRLRREWESATWADAGWLLFCALLFWASKWTGKLLDGVPGHAGAFWIPTLLLAQARVGRPGASTLTALIGAAFWSVPRSDGMGGLAPYVAAGLVLDLIARDGAAVRRLPLALLAGALAHLAKFGAHNLPAAVLGAPVHFMTWGLAPVAALHLLFGLIGGFVGWLLVTATSRDGVG